MTFTWHCGYGYIPFMKTVNAGKFKDQCLRIMDAVARTKTPVIVTKRKHPVVKIVPYAEASCAHSSLDIQKVA